MSYYRPRISNRAMSGQYAPLIGKTVSWEENHAYADPASEWKPASGRVVVVGRGGASYWVQDEYGCRRWIDPAYNAYRNVVVQ